MYCLLCVFSKLSPFLHILLSSLSLQFFSSSSLSQNSSGFKLALDSMLCVKSPQLPSLCATVTLLCLFYHLFICPFSFSFLLPLFPILISSSFPLWWCNKTRMHGVVRLVWHGNHTTSLPVVPISQVPIASRPYPSWQHILCHPPQVTHRRRGYFLHSTSSLQLQMLVP